MEANAAAYLESARAGAPQACWDFVVLTAANEKQAEGYRQELALRHRPAGPAGPLFPEAQKSVVVSDPPGHKAGSGGATLGVLRALSKQFDLSPRELSLRRVLLIHSGGMSQRLPMYAALGKIFMPLPLPRPDGQLATLFDHLYVTLAGLPARLGPGMLVAAGDVFLAFDHRGVSAPPPGVTAISMRVSADLGRGHGVFVTGGGGTVMKTLQKVSVDEMKAAGATDARGRVLIDTGLLFFDPARTQVLLGLSRAVRAKSEIDLYDDVTAALAAGTNSAAYLRAGRSGAVRHRLWGALHGTPFNVAEVPGEFLHLGTTRQLRDAMTGRDPSPAASLFRQNVLVRGTAGVPAGARVYGCFLSGRKYPCVVSDGAVVEQCQLDGPFRIGRGSVVSQAVNLTDRLDLPPDSVFFQVMVRDRRGPLRMVQVVCGVDDDFKGRHADGRCVFLNRPIDSWLHRNGIRPQHIWHGVPAGERTLWNARLFPATEFRDGCRSVLPLARARAAPAEAVAAWRALPRYSMAEAVAAANTVSLTAGREVIVARLQALEAARRIYEHDDRAADAAIGNFSTIYAYSEAEVRLFLHARRRNEELGRRRRTRVIQDGAPELIENARVAWTIAQLLRRPDYAYPPGASYLVRFNQGRAEGFAAEAFEAVAKAAEVGARSAAPVRPVGRLQVGIRVSASAPARLDLAGGWTDTPPYCFERGGHVVNVGIDLDGRPPVTATVSTLKQAVVLLESVDLGQTVELADGDVAGPVDVADPFALHKVALRTAGLLSDDTPLRKRLGALGVGLHVVTDARVPKGSGLGTSSILAATLLAALHAVGGRKVSSRQLIEQTLVLEQRLSTGGGWQDQVGGVKPGVKSTVSRPGVPQRLSVEVLNLPEPRLRALEERLVVYYTGQQRLARDILRQVTGRWLGREPAVVGLMEALKQAAAAMRAALLRGDWPAAAEQVNRYWQIKKELYPGSTTAAIDRLFEGTRGHCLAAGLAGAGGGGFAYFFCKDGRQATRLRGRLAERASEPGSQARVFAARINREGLRVSRSKVT